MNTINLYIGYEGYSEIILKEKLNNSNQIIFEVHLLEFHFNEVLSFIPLGQYHPESIMYNYFRKNGWYDAEWECKRKQEFLDQLNAINNSIPSNLQSVYDAIKQICQSAIAHENHLYIELD